MPSPEIIAILDLEWTAWEGSLERRWQGPGEEIEIVQIGIIKLQNDETLSEMDTFEVLVTPRINPILSDYFINLTGISQARLDSDGMELADALAAAQSFLGINTGTVYSYGQDYIVIRNNCNLIDIPFPFDESLFDNVRDHMARFVGKEVAEMESNQLPKALGFLKPGTSHQAVDDCRCVAEALRIIRKQGMF